MGRIIDEDAVIALIDLKINAAQERMEVLENENIAENGSAISLPSIEMMARIGALKVLKSHLKFIESKDLRKTYSLQELIDGVDQKPQPFPEEVSSIITSLPNEATKRAQ